MSCDVQKVIEVAKAENNYLEKETWDQLDSKTANAGDKNFVKYSRDLAKINYFNSSKKGVAWCSIFVAWDFVMAYGKNAARKLLCQPSTGNCGAGCNSAMNYFKNKGRLFTDPKVGDVIFFWSSSKPNEASHTGLVTKVSGSYVYTIEGNTSSDSGVVENGGAVNDKKYRLNHERIAGYGRPDYEGVNPDAGYDTQKDTVETKEDKNMIVGQAWVAAKTGKTVNFRKSPSKSATRVPGCNSIPSGEEVYINSSTDTWAAIEYKGYKGYMMMEFLTQERPDTAIDDTVSESRSPDQIVAEITALLAELAAKAK